jgi:hypothetical protein
MVWGCMDWNDAGKLAENEGRMDSDKYVNFLGHHLLASFEGSGIGDDEHIFQ